LDVELDRFQVRIYKRLPFENFNGYGRAYLLQKEKKVVPWTFGQNNDYEKELLTDDSLNGHFFFVEKENSKFAKDTMETEIEVYFMLDVKKLKPDITHRGDEEVKDDIVRAIIESRIFLKNEFNIINGQKALDDFEHNLVDMQPYHFIKFVGKIKYNYNC
jgi:hypothetical protein